jgi:plastocyanin
VTWTNDDTAPHNVTYVSGPKFNSSGTLNMGGTFQIKVTTPGTIHYFCSIHPFMKSTVVVSK